MLAAEMIVHEIQPEHTPATASSGTGCATKPGAAEIITEAAEISRSAFKRDDVCDFPLTPATAGRNGGDAPEQVQHICLDTQAKRSVAVMVETQQAGPKMGFRRQPIGIERQAGFNM